MTEISPGPADADGYWLDHPDHRAFLAEDATRQLDFFTASLRDGPGFHTLGPDGTPLPSDLQELHTTTRLVHSYALGKRHGHPDADRIIDHGMNYLWSHHRDQKHGGYLYGLTDDAIADDRKLAYGHVFVLLAASSARTAGHPDADRLLADISDVLDTRFWEDGPGRFADEWNRDWTPFSTYRGMNANMHGVEALLAAYQATGESLYLTRAGRILDFFTDTIARDWHWRLPEHYTAEWQVDRAYSGDPMFRPAGTTPGHSFELGRLLLEHWLLSGKADHSAPTRARALIETALTDAWLPSGGLAYTLDFDGSVAIPSRFWWPVTEAIGAVAALIRTDPRPQDEAAYRRLWTFAAAHFIDPTRGGWFPEIDAAGAVTTTIFKGKPDLYHSLQACLFQLDPLVKGTLSPT